MVICKIEASMAKAGMSKEERSGGGSRPLGFNLDRILLLLHADKPLEDFEQRSDMAWLLKMESAALLRWTVVGKSMGTGKWVEEEADATSRETQ